MLYLGRVNKFSIKETTDDDFFFLKLQILCTLLIVLSQLLDFLQNEEMCSSKDNLSILITSSFTDFPAVYIDCTYLNFVSL